MSQILLGDTAFKEKGEDHELVKIFEVLNDELEKYFKGEFELPLTNDIVSGERRTIKPQE